MLVSVVMVVRFKVEGIDSAAGVAQLHDAVASKVNELAKQMGAIHHDCFYSPSTGEGVVIDEWPSPADAEAFWSTDTFGAAMAEAGVGPLGEVLVLEKAPLDPQYRF
jgi:hypothetical protein